MRKLEQIELTPIQWAEQMPLSAAPYQVLNALAKITDQYGRGITTLLKLIVCTSQACEVIENALVLFKTEQIVIFFTPLNSELIHYQLRIKINPKEFYISLNEEIINEEGTEL